MEEVSAAFGGRATKVEAGQHIHSLRSPSKHTTSKNLLTTRRSIIDLAINFFKPTRVDEVEASTPKHEKNERVMGPWNPFSSIRNKATRSATARSKSFSPQKRADLGVDEFGRRNVMRRKSLQDLLGTVGSKLTLTRRRAPQSERYYEESTESEEISPLVLPEPAIPISGSPNVLLDSLYLYSKDLQPVTVLVSHGEPVVYLDREQSPPNGLKTCSDSPMDGPLRVPEDSSVTGLHSHSQDLNRTSPSVSSERLFPTMPTDFQREPSPPLPAHVRFVDEEGPPQYRNSKDLEDRNTFEPADVDPCFPSRALSREAKYNTICNVSAETSVDSPTKDIEGHVALVAEKMLKIRHDSTSQSTWSEGSSETETPDLSDDECVEKKEVQDVVDIGKEIMELRRLSPYLHSRETKISETSLRKEFFGATNPALEEAGSAEILEITLPFDGPSSVQSVAPLHYEESLASKFRCKESEEQRTPPAQCALPATHSREPELELCRSEDLALSDDRLQKLDEYGTQKVNSGTNQKGIATSSFKTGDRLRARRANFRMVSTELVHVYYPPNEFHDAYTRTYSSKGEAIGDLYQNHDEFSDYCLFDRKTRTFYPQERSELRQDSLHSNDENSMEVVWLPLEMFPEDSPLNQADRENYNLDAFKGYVSDLKGLPPSAEACASTSSSELVQKPAHKNSNVIAFDGIKNQASTSTDDGNAYLEYGALKEYGDSSSDADSLAGSNHRLTVRKTRAVNSSAARNLVSEDFISNPDDMDDPYDIAVDSATARLYLGSLFSSTDSLRSTGQEGFARPDSVNSIWSKLNDAQPEEATQIKTWVELEHEFLDKFAPDSQISPSQRGRLAVSEAIKKLNGCVDSSDNDETFISDTSDPGFQDASGSENEQWLRYGEAYECTIFEYVEDIVKYERIREELTTAASSLYIRGASPQSLIDGPNTKIDGKGKGKEIASPSKNVSTFLIERATARVHGEEGFPEQQGADRKMTSTKPVFMRHNPQESSRGFCCNSKSGILCSDCENGVGESSECEDIAITMPTGCKFTKYSEMLLEGRGEARIPCESECVGQGTPPGSPDTVIAPVSNFLVLTDIYRSKSSNELTDMNTGNASSTIEMLNLKENGNARLDIATTVQVLPLQSRVVLSSPRPKHFTSLESVSTIYADALSNPAPSTPRLPTSKRVPTPSKRINNPLAELSSLQRLATPRMSAPPSEADTEASDDFGHKLQRYSRAGEDVKENEDRWWTDSISYG